MTPEVLAIFAQFGLAGVILFFAGIYFWKKDQQHNLAMQKKDETHTAQIIALQNNHREERKELVDTLTRQHSEALQVTRETGQALSNNTVAVTELTTIIRASAK